MQLYVLGKVLVTAAALVAVTIHGCEATVTGGIQIRVPKITTATAWCEFYGAKVMDGVATLFKAVDDKYMSAPPYPGKPISYAPGETPVAPDWDGGEQECGGGLHFASHPSIAKSFNENATRFLACPVKLEDIAVHENASSPEKIKARGCCAPVYEVDEDGDPVVSETSATQSHASQTGSEKAA